jgi:tRNA U38,U39,U40 pseudouridine synthase TruA
MVHVVVRYAYGRIQKNAVKNLLNCPDPTNFHAHKLIAAPPSGLFLVDVVYDPDMFTNPVPEVEHAWDRGGYFDGDRAEEEEEEEEECDLLG